MEEVVGSLASRPDSIGKVGSSNLLIPTKKIKSLPVLRVRIFIFAVLLAKLAKTKNKNPYAAREGFD